MKTSMFLCFHVIFSPLPTFFFMEKKLPTCKIKLAEETGYEVWVFGLVPRPPHTGVTNRVKCFTHYQPYALSSCNGIGIEVNIYIETGMGYQTLGMGLMKHGNGI